MLSEESVSFISVRVLHQCAFVVVQDGDYFLNMMSSEEERLHQQAKRAEGLMRSQDLPEEGSVK